MRQTLNFDRPIEATVVLLALFELSHGNSHFRAVLLELFLEDQTAQQMPLLLSVITLSSYLLAHATSLASTRAIAYADLSLSILLAFVEREEILVVLCQPRSFDIHICRQVRLKRIPSHFVSFLICCKIYYQRPPILPLPASPRPPICALLDCCVLWFRHNLHKRLEVTSYL